MRRDSPRYGNFPKRRKSRESPWNRASPAFGKLWEHAGKCRVDLLLNLYPLLEEDFIKEWGDVPYIVQLSAELEAMQIMDIR